MKIETLLKNKPDNLTLSLEITPPRRGMSIDVMFKTVEEVEPYNPLWIDVTSHSADVEWIRDPGLGGYRKRSFRKSPGTIAICGAIEHKFGIRTVPHILCNGFYREETEDALIDLHYLGVRNLLAIRGDGKPKEPTEVRKTNRFATDLVQQIEMMNQGRYLHDFEAEPTEFCVGVACYPEKHFEAPNSEYDLEWFKKKQEAGAKYAVTQMFFDNEKFYSFMDSAKAHISIPVIPALKIITSKEQLVTITKHFHINIPPALVEGIEAAKSKKDAAKVGIEWASEQCRDLMEKGYKHIHFYIMKKTEPFVNLMGNLGVRG